MPNKISAKAASKYTNPALRERLKKKLMDGDKGGRTGQWSARKSQLLVQEYEKHGGGYRGKKDSPAKSLEKWTKESWQTRDGKARAGTDRKPTAILPEKAWEKLTPAQKRATDRKKKRGSVKGKQFVANTTAAKNARRKVSNSGKR